MFTRLTAYVDNARRRLAELNARAALDDANDLDHPSVTSTTGDDEDYGNEFDYYSDEATAAGDVQLEYHAGEDNGNGVEDKNDDAGNKTADAGHPSSGQHPTSIRDLLAQCELERRLAEEGGGSDGSRTEIEDTPDDERPGAEERLSRAAENIAWASMSDESRAASLSAWDDIVRIAAEDRRIADEKERKRRELECGPNCVHCTRDWDSDSDADSTGEDSDPATVPTSSNKPDNAHAAARATHSPPPAVAETAEEAWRRSPTPDVYAAPLANAERFVPAAPVLKSQDVGMTNEDLAAIHHGGDCSPSRDEGTSSQVWQQVQDPVTPHSTSRKQKRARSDDDHDVDALSGKRRRVDTEEQPGSPRPRAGKHHNQNTAGSSSAATRSTTHQVFTATSTAPQHEFEGATVADIHHAVSGSRLSDPDGIDFGRSSFPGGCKDPKAQLAGSRKRDAVRGKSPEHSHPRDCEHPRRRGSRCRSRGVAAQGAWGARWEGQGQGQGPRVMKRGSSTRRPAPLRPWRLEVARRCLQPPPPRRRPA